MRRAWDVQRCENWWISFGFHIDHTDPSVTIHLPGIIVTLGRIKQPGFRSEPLVHQGVDELERAIAYAHERLGSEQPDGPEDLAESLRQLVDERAGWIEVAVDSNKTVHAYLESQGVEMPCGMPVDGIQQLVRALQ